MARATLHDLGIVAAVAVDELAGRCVCSPRDGWECVEHAQDRELAESSRMLAAAIDTNDLLDVCLARGAHRLLIEAHGRELGRVLLDAGA